ncbi:hypothetical protein ACFPTY_03450 [Halomonas beimenensis]|uniref:Uncharacterized protein n=1 Tax=Halomonas beimenensis TaxID=475662 RepID=A0A291P583_9GAMM|nr:hypothetical protein [Halomonas beimenensis]ATJ82018.1 hypothetical protein BEI_1031 [Halomonas beimenensis]
MLEDMHGDKVIIEKTDGRQLGPVAASVQKSTVYIPHAREPIEMGDVL